LPGRSLVCHSGSFGSSSRADVSSLRASLDVGLRLLDWSWRRRAISIYLLSDAIGKFDVLVARLPSASRKGSFREAPDPLLAILNDARPNRNRK